MRTRYYHHGPGDFREYPPERAINPRFGTAPYIQCDLQEPIRITGTNEYLGSNAERREYMNRTGYEEVGDNAPKWLQEAQYLQKHGAKPEECPGDEPEIVQDEGVSFEFQDFKGDK